MASHPSRAGGFLLMVCILGGVIAGTARGEPSLGFLLGTAAGTLLALLIWLIDRHRR